MYLRWADLNEEAAPLVGDLEDFGPGEAVDPQLVLIDHQTAGADAQHDVHPLQVLSRGQVCNEGTKPSQGHHLQ